MYIPKHFQQKDKHLLIQTIRTIKLGALIIFSENNFFSAHIPFIIKENGNDIILEGHVSKANEIWKHALKDNKAMIIFQGAHAYIHPGWYATKAKTGKVVPTWNYEAVHCYGHSEKQQNEEWILQHVDELTRENGEDKQTPWHISDAPQDYIHTLIKGIVGIKFHIDKIEGVLKMNQNHPEDNRLGVIEGLSKSGKTQEQEVAKIMCQLEINKTHS